MVNELKVYNRFGELTLHLRHSLGPAPELITIDATEDMRAAVAELRGNDFDRTIAKAGELVRLTADWTSSQFLPVLAQYLAMNFGWRTQTIEVKERASFVLTNVSEHRPESQPRVEFRSMPNLPLVPRPNIEIYGISAE
ncbi:MAG TPA: hypothetical protein VE377_20520 [Candidatus Dormibacteraeota bacterium]|nr:hypothetical protein [Candidatus Dormibacteraeota bacterium]